ncbi:MAG: asparagine synthetase B, partial [Candidatus Wallbacteria bacterium]|nr:asparagine synthetase B [Candidatus Wallbacteria bacterium]
ARKVAEHLGTDHTQLIVTPEDALAVIPRLPALWDEPFADSSQIPTFLLSELTRRHVTVSLSGDGGDELFCGYSRYATARTIWNVIGFLPGPLRRMFAHALRCIPAQAFAGFVRAAGNCLPETVRKGNPADRFRKLADILSTAGPQALYRDMVSHWREPSSIVLGSHEPCTVLNDPSAWARVPGLEEHMMYADTVSYLHDDILVKVDRASMGVGLEARVPLLDHRVVEFAARVPLSLKVRNGHSKWILRQVLARYVPERLFDRPKMGFGVPLDSWLRAPLRTWAEALLDESRLRREGFFDPAPIRQKWREHLSGERNWHYYLWDVLMFQVWLETTA